MQLERPTVDDLTRGSTRFIEKNRVLYLKGRFGNNYSII